MLLVLFLQVKKEAQMVDLFTETPKELFDHPKFAPRLILFLTFEETAKKIEVLVELNYRSSDIPNLPGKWSYLWQSVWLLEIESKEQLLKIAKDRRVVRISLDG